MSALFPWLLVLAAAFVYAGIAAGSNAYQIGRNYNVGHHWEARERLAALAGFVVLAYYRLPVWFWWVAPLNFLAACLLFGFWFDLRLNRRRGLVWDYVGTDAATAKADKLVNRFKLSGTLYAVLKLAGVVALTILIAVVL